MRRFVDLIYGGLISKKEKFNPAHTHAHRPPLTSGVDTAHTQPPHGYVFHVYATSLLFAVKEIASPCSYPKSTEMKWTKPSLLASPSSNTGAPFPVCRLRAAAGGRGLRAILMPGPAVPTGPIPAAAVHRRPTFPCPPSALERHTRLVDGGC